MGNSSSIDAAIRRALGKGPKYPRKRTVVPEETRAAIKQAKQMVRDQDITLYRGFVIRRSPFGHGFIPERGGFKYAPKPTLADAKKDVDDIEG